MASTKNAITRVARKHKPAYKRILLKLSGEAFQGPQGFGIHGETIRAIARELKEVHALGVETAIMVGGGNIFRDRKSTRLNSSHLVISYAVFCLKKKNIIETDKWLQ